VIGLEMSPLTEAVMRYFEFRGYKVPDATQAMLFLTSETGELADEVVQKTSEEWVRNHPENKGKGIAPEAGDVIMMTCAVCSAVGVDPIEAMFEKMTAKGFDKDA
jgi:NTP pyrophosphatase (non-canonical NTP hydrolase)